MGYLTTVERLFRFARFLVYNPFTFDKGSKAVALPLSGVQLPPN
jgi:hypothetical protein